MEAAVELSPQPPVAPAPAAEPGAESAAPPAAAPRLPRVELFCRAAARGETLAAAARRAGYSPASARQRGSELWAREDVQARIGELMAEEECHEQERIGRMRQRLDEVVEALMTQGNAVAAGRMLIQQWRFEKEVRGIGGMPAHERERLREELRDEMRAEVATELRGELLEEFVAELREEIAWELRDRIAAELRDRIAAELRDRIAAELRAEMAAERRGPARPEQSVTDHDAAAHSAGSTPAPTPAPAGRPAVEGTRPLTLVRPPPAEEEPGAIEAVPGLSPGAAASRRRPPGLDGLPLRPME